jgi:hypothetical protein
MGSGLRVRLASTESRGDLFGFFLGCAQSTTSAELAKAKLRGWAGIENTRKGAMLSCDRAWWSLWECA